MQRNRIVLVVLCLTVSAGFAAEAAKKTWSFDDQEPGKIAAGFTNEVGAWSVTQTDESKALAQTAKNGNPVFNLTLITDTHFSDVDLTVKMKAVAGEIDQGGGLVWRAKDAKNYYLARYNPLEDNYRLYHVVNGKRTLIQNVDIAHSDGWHTLRVVMKGKHLECFYDDKKYLEREDETIKQPGMIGLWSKADAQSYFDDLTAIGE